MSGVAKEDLGLFSLRQGFDLRVVLPEPLLDQVLRDDLDENGGGDLDFEAAAGSGVMIVADLQLCKFFRRRC